MGLYNKIINLSLHEHKDLPTHIEYSEYKKLICIKSFFLNLPHGTQLRQKPSRLFTKNEQV